MHPVLHSCQWFLRVLADLLDAVYPNAMTGAAAGTVWPAFASKAVAARFRRGLRIAEAYLRRVLLLMALEMEPMLVDPRTPLGRPKARRWSAPSVRLTVLNERVGAVTPAVLEAFERAGEARRHRPLTGREPVKMAPLYRRLDFLRQVAQNPLGRARRLALNLARRRPGPILAPDLDLRLPQRWGTEVSMSFGLLRYKIIETSRSRPPPQPPLQRHWPTVRLLEW
jgi:hypothetical protein